MEYNYSIMGEDLHFAYRLGLNIGIGRVHASCDSHNAWDQIRYGKYFGDKLCGLGHMTRETFKELNGVNPTIIGSYGELEPVRVLQDLYPWLVKYTDVLANGISETPAPYRDLYYLGVYIGMAEAQALQFQNGNQASDKWKRMDLDKARQYAQRVKKTYPAINPDELYPDSDYNNVKRVREGWNTYFETQV